MLTKFVGMKKLTLHILLLALSGLRLPLVYITAVAIRYYCCVKKLVGKQQKSGIGRKRTRDQQLQSYDISKIYLSLPN